MTAKELKAILRDNVIAIPPGLTEKHELVDTICGSEKVDIIDPSEVKEEERDSGANSNDEYYESDFLKMNVEHIRNAFKMFGLVVPSASENQSKDELIGLLFNSGKVRRDPASKEDE